MTLFRQTSTLLQVPRPINLFAKIRTYFSQLNRVYVLIKFKANINFIETFPTLLTEPNLDSNSKVESLRKAEEKEKVSRNAGSNFPKHIAYQKRLNIKYILKICNLFWITYTSLK